MNRSFERWPSPPRIVEDARPAMTDPLPTANSAAATSSIPHDAVAPHAANKRRGLIQIHIAALLVGFPGLFPKWLALDSSVITFGRLFVGSIALLLFARFARASLRIHTWRHGLSLVLAGGALALNWFAFFKSIQVSTVAIGVLAFSTFPLFVTFLEPLFFDERFHWADLATVLVVAAGLATIAPILDVGNSLTQGVLWGMLCALSCALVSLLSRSCVRNHPPVTVTFYQQAFGALFTLPAWFAFQGTLTAHDVGLLILLGVAFTALAQALIAASLRHIRAQLASVVIALESVYGILFAMLFLHEIPTWRTVCGGLLICAAVFHASWRHAQPTPSPSPTP
jgi:drug/metabolite transporter (DMT)-like permease